MSFYQVASFTQSDDVAQDAERGEAHEGEDEDQEGISLNRVMKACLSQSTMISAIITIMQSGISTQNRSKYIIY